MPLVSGIKVSENKTKENENKTSLRVGEALSFKSLKSDACELQVFSGEVTGLTPALKDSLDGLNKLALHLGQVQVAAGLRDIDPEEFVTTTVRPSLVQVRVVPSGSFSAGSSAN